MNAGASRGGEGCLRERLQEDTGESQEHQRSRLSQDLMAKSAGPGAKLPELEPGLPHFPGCVT